MRRGLALFLPVLVAGLMGCSERTDSARNATPRGSTEQPAADTNRQRDNTAVNERDRGNGTLTATDQAENQNDRTITQSIRKAIVSDDALSTDAQNVKIITANGMVTLRGPVNTEQEKKSIADKAQQIAGVTRVDNQLEVITR